MAEEEGIQNKKSNFSEWFHEVIEKAGIIDQRYPLQGFLVYPWYGFAIHESCMRILEGLLDRTGHKKCYFPPLIPERLIKKEAEHIHGFEDEVFWVTQAGKNPMEERCALRPTSETVMYEMLKLWIRSHRDLPVKIYQSTSVFRYETKHTRPLIRDREILWNEAHTSHATAGKAAKQIEEGVAIYQELFDKIAVPVKFFDVMVGVFAGAAGAVEPYTVFPDGRVVEMGSVNNLGQRFSKAFDVKFAREDGSEEHVYQTCYGVSERMTAAIVALHGDDKGLVLPPSVAPTQVVIVPIYNNKTKKAVISYAQNVCKKLCCCMRVEVDAHEECTPGWKFNHYEMLGVPLRVEIGPKEAKGKSVTIVSRIDGKKETVKLAGVEKTVCKKLDDAQKVMLEHAKKTQQTNDVGGMSELKNIIGTKGGFVRVGWCGGKECADWIKSETKGGEIIGTLHGKSEKPAGKVGKCIYCGKKAEHVVYVANMY